jgi:hypothetical protein
MGEKSIKYFWSSYISSITPTKPASIVTDDKQSVSESKQKIGNSKKKTIMIVNNAQDIAQHMNPSYHRLDMMLEHSLTPAQLCMNIYPILFAMICWYGIFTCKASMAYSSTNTSKQSILHAELFLYQLLMLRESCQYSTQNETKRDNTQTGEQRTICKCHENSSDPITTTT